MKKSILLIPIILLLFIQTGHAQSTYQLNPDSANTVMIEGTSNLHDWECSVDENDINAVIDDRALQDSASDSFLQKLDFTAVVNSIECGRRKMNNKTYDILKSEEHPTIDFVLNKSSITQKADSSSSFTLDVTGDLTMAGMTKSVSFPVEGQRLASNEYHFIGSYTFKTTDFDIDRVSMLFGSIKTGEEVTIPFEVTLSAQ